MPLDADGWFYIVDRKKDQINGRLQGVAAPRAPRPRLAGPAAARLADQDGGAYAWVAMIVTQAKEPA
jgi:hypothetical protein